MSMEMENVPPPPPTDQRIDMRKERGEGEEEKRRKNGNRHPSISIVYATMFIPSPIYHLRKALEKGSRE